MSRYKYRRVHGWTAVALLVISLLITLGQQHGWFSSVTQLQPGTYSIDHFVDGDTIAVNMAGKTEDVRFIGVDTPETHKPNTPVECYGPEAAAYTKAEIGIGPVRLVSDSLSTDRDRYGRLLRYVYLPDGKLLEDQLIRNGYGFYYPYFPFTKSSQFAADEKQAQTHKLGLWAHCHPTPTDQGGYKMNQTEPKTNQ
ncbi:MAG TPA: thermonuclease family protein [Candidatus Saccharimonadales bacterium]|nr:thermonuclease family protein [Candidatus Saccharimonadales bacterium]